MEIAETKKTAGSSRMRLTHLGLGVLLGMAVVAGCKSVSLTPYVAPRVEGRVVDSQTHQPIAGVQVRRTSANEDYNDTTQPPKGGEVLARAPAVRTGADGLFVLDSVRDLVVLRKAGWYSISLSFQHAGYDGFTATYTVADATNSYNGEPLVKTGDVLLIPTSGTK